MNRKEFEQNPDEILADPQGYIAAYQAVDSFMDYGKRAGRVIASRLESASKLLAANPAGTKLIFVGDCPSGSTYTDPVTWDGTEESRQKILKLVIHNTVFRHASDAYLDLQANQRRGMFAADIKTGRF